MPTPNNLRQEPVNLTALEAALRGKLTAKAPDVGEMEKLGAAIRERLIICVAFVEEVAAIRERLTKYVTAEIGMDKLQAALNEGLGIELREILTTYAAAKTDMDRLQVALKFELIAEKVLGADRFIEGTLHHAVRAVPITLIPESVAEGIRRDVQNRGNSVNPAQAEQEIKAAVERVCVENGKADKIMELQLVVMAQIWRAIENHCRRNMGCRDPLGPFFE